VSLRKNIRRRPITGNDQPDGLVLAPSDFWEEIFQAQLESTIASNERLPGQSICAKNDSFSTSRSIFGVLIHTYQERFSTQKKCSMLANQRFTGDAPKSG
jgi:hypothetical protein